MPTIQVKNLPPETHAVWRRRAAAAHQSLQEYVRAHMVEAAREPTLAELFGEIEQDSGGSLSLEDAVRIIRADRDSR